MKKMRWFLVFTAIVLLSGCASELEIAKQSEMDNSEQRFDKAEPVDFNSELIKKPAIGTITVANIGDSMIATFRKTIIPTLVLNNDITQVGKTIAGNTRKFLIRKGYLQLIRKNSDGRFFSAKDNFSLEVNGKVSPTGRGGIFLYNNKPNSAAIFFGDYGFDPIPNIVDFEIIEKEEWSKESFNKELIYTGKSGNIISILYREFINDMARPAFTQEVKYDLSESKTIGYKEARFEVIAADNQSIQFKVIKHLE